MQRWHTEVWPPSCSYQDNGDIHLPATALLEKVREVTYIAWLASSRHEIIVSFLNLFLLFTPKTGTINFNSFPSFRYSSAQQTHTVAAEVCCLLYRFVLAASAMIPIS